MSVITAYCRLTEDVCAVNGEVKLRRNVALEDSWFKQIYRHFDFSYPKFYKMDKLSQAGFLASELLRKINPGIMGYGDDEIALLFANRSSSAETDQRFKDSYTSNSAPSPSTFVYTLPNIVIGEIAIRNKWYGENMFAVLPKFAPDFYKNYAQILTSSDSKAVLCGWLEVTAGNTDVFLFTVEEKEGGTEFSEENLFRLLETAATH
ncbi:hypothetical protein LZD49_25155 [Dyadobacter sp. CY261]|uniref:hypothetical protein n=1 Tax=Dyadobacter sp. CY261 TaxID=2907203 RepID=UPI001F459095|nr:hypothetical protein [Dyadobacter sp. CY261]MCF0073792.1 hypothetical protein [Dyadobacter sp. CY261]